MTVRLFALLHSANTISVNHIESEGFHLEENFIAGQAETTARVTFEDHDYYFRDQDVELVDGECVAVAEDWQLLNDQDAESQADEHRETCRLSFAVTKPLTLDDIIPPSPSTSTEQANEPVPQPEAAEPQQAIPLRHFIGEGRLPFLIIGRVPGDDDDTGYLVMADDEGQAQAVFVEQLHADADNDTEERVRLTDNYQTDHFITASQGLF